MAKLISSWSNNVKTMPSDYVMPLEERPGIVAVCKGVPVIDLAQAGDQHRRADIVEQILKAYEEFGVFQVINHGVSDELMQDAKSLYEEIFNMSVEDKASLYSEDLTKACRVYTGALGFRKDGARFWKDSMQHPCYPLEQHIASWPEKPARFREVVGRYVVEVRKAGLRILDLIGEGLGLREGYFEGDLTNDQTITTNYYPPCPDPSSAIGTLAHTDPNLITLLQQDFDGLQILKDGQWLGVEAIPNAFVVVGCRQLEIISNGKLKSPEHRGVPISTAARTSIVTFIGPTLSTVVQPAKEIVASSGGSPRFKALVYGEFKSNFLGYYGKNVSFGTPLDPYKL